MSNVCIDVTERSLCCSHQVPLSHVCSVRGRDSETVRREHHLATVGSDFFMPFLSISNYSNIGVSGFGTRVLQAPGSRPFFFYASILIFVQILPSISDCCCNTIIHCIVCVQKGQIFERPIYIS